MITVRLTLGLALVLAGVAPSLCKAQVGGILKRKVRARVEQATGRAVDSALNRAENAVTCLVTDAACIKRARAAGKAVAVTDASGKPVSSADSAAAVAGPTVRPGEGAWANYDFVPGDRTLFVEDFKTDNVGDFPRRLQFKRGNMEVVEWQAGRYLQYKGPGGGTFDVVLPEVLPDRFTMEFDYAGNGTLKAEFSNAGNVNSVECNDYQSGVVGGDVSASGGAELNTSGKMIHCRVMADGRYVKVYMNDTRVANVPNANLGRTNKITFSFSAGSERGLLGNLHVAAGGKALYDALAEEGRVSTHGILFDVGSDQLRPESTPTLKQIGDMLTQHPALKLTIEGHTDNVGGDAANQALSERRAAAVKQYLVSTYLIDAGRLATKGFGASKPVSPNATAEGRQNNRRVELVKM